MFDQIEGAGFDGHYMLAFGSMDDMKAGRDALLHLARRS
jgi:hypothetical protein